MKSIEIRSSLPFSWCRFCTRIDLETQKWIADGQVEEIENVCANAAVCEACERARAADLRPADLADSSAELVNPYMEEYYGQWYHCSICGAEGLSPGDKFCPGCGAKLKEAVK